MSGLETSWTGGPFVQLVLARVREFVRAPEAVFWVYVFPVIMVVALGVAFRSRPIERFLVELPGPLSESSPLQALLQDQRFQVRQGSQDESRMRLRAGKSDLLILNSENGVGFEFVFDPTKPTAWLARNAADDLLQRRAGRKDVLANSDRELTEPGGRYVDFLIPGMLGMGLMGGGLWGVGFAIVDMRIRKVLKLFLATPMKRPQFLAALMTSRILFSIPEIVFLLFFARLAFGVANHGSYGVLILLIALGAIQFSGIGLLVASRAKTLESVSGLMNLVMMPMWILSGIFFSTDRFPQFAQPLISILPLTPLIRSMRQVMLEGAGLVEVAPQIAIMAVWAVATFAVALKVFRWS